MRQLLPEPLDEVDVASRYAADERPPHRTGRPWLLTNMVASIDGATAVDGRSGALGGPGDREVFRAVRAVADTILVGAGTARAEDYGPPSGGQRLAIVSGRAELDPAARVFGPGPGPRPLVLAGAAAPADRLEALRPVADVEVAPTDRVEPAWALHRLGALGARVVLSEGGPTLNGLLVGAGLVDEWCQTIAPVLAGGPSARSAVADEAPAVPTELRLDRLLRHDDGTLFARYVRSAAGPGS